MEKIGVGLREYKTAKKGDLLLHDGVKFNPVSLDELLLPIKNKIKDLEQLKHEINSLKRLLARYIKEDLK